MALKLLPVPGYSGVHRHNPLNGNDGKVINHLLGIEFCVCVEMSNQYIMFIWHVERTTDDCRVACKFENPRLQMTHPAPFLLWLLPFNLWFPFLSIKAYTDTIWSPKTLAAADWKCVNFAICVVSNVDLTECEPPLCVILICRIDLFIFQHTVGGGAGNSQSFVTSR